MKNWSQSSLDISLWASSCLIARLSKLITLKWLNKLDKLVADVSKKLAEKLNLSEEDILLAELIGLFHDLGRFPQFSGYKTFIDSKIVSVEKRIIKLNSLSPNKIANMGYSKLFKNNKLVLSASELSVGDNINVSLKDGNLNCKVIKKG